MTRQIKRISNNLTLHRCAVISLLPVSYAVIIIESIWKGIKWFCYYQRESFGALFYEIHMNFSYCHRKYMNREFWNWNGID